MLAKTLSLVYNVLGMLPFALFNADMVKEVWPDIKEETCKAGAFGRQGPCTTSLEFTVGKVYLQVIVGVALLYAATIALDGKSGLLGAMGCMIATMTKHVVVDGLIPPPPVMVMTAGVVVAILGAPGAWGQRAFVAYALVNAVTFVTSPLMVLQDTFPEITPDSDAFKIGAFALEVIGLYMVMAGVYVATADKRLGLAYATQVGALIVCKHVIIDKSGPPTPLIFLYAATTAAAWYEVGWANFKPATEKAIKQGPMKMHGLIVGCSFVPYFALEALGQSIPLVGFAASDTSYSYTGATALFCASLAIFSAISAYTEWSAHMEGKLFAMYHYFLSLAVAFWQLQPTTTTAGALFFCAPHAFTAWTIYLVVTMEPPTKRA